MNDVTDKMLQAGLEARDAALTEDLNDPIGAFFTGALVVAKAATATARAEAEAKDAIILQQAVNAAKAAKEYADNMAALRAEVERLRGALSFYADPTNYRSFHDEDSEESIACIPCGLTPADEEGNRIFVFDSGAKARAALASEPGK